MYTNLYTKHIVILLFITPLPFAETTYQNKQPQVLYLFMMEISLKLIYQAIQAFFFLLETPNATIPSPRKAKFTGSGTDVAVSLY